MTHIALQTANLQKRDARRNILDCNSRTVSISIKLVSLQHQQNECAPLTLRQDIKAGDSFVKCRRWQNHNFMNKVPKWMGVRPIY